MMVEYINKLKSKVLSVRTLSVAWIKTLLIGLVKIDAFKFMAQTIAYGVLFNIPFSVFFNRAFSPATILAYGILYYFISEELPIILFKIRGGRKQ